MYYCPTPSYSRSVQTARSDLAFKKCHSFVTSIITCTIPMASKIQTNSSLQTRQGALLKSSTGTVLPRKGMEKCPSIHTSFIASYAEFVDLYNFNSIRNFSVRYCDHTTREKSTKLCPSVVCSSRQIEHNSHTNYHVHETSVGSSGSGSPVPLLGVARHHRHLLNTSPLC